MVLLISLFSVATDASERISVHWTVTLSRTTLWSVKISPYRPVYLLEPRGPVLAPLATAIGVFGIATALWVTRLQTTDPDETCGHSLVTTE